MAFLFHLARFDWWLYLIVVVTFFSVALLFNYIIKKINESRIEERFVRLRYKGSTSRSIQVQRQLDNSVPTRSPLEVVVDQSNPPTAKGISLVFNKDENLMEDRRKKDQIDISFSLPSNFPDSQELSITDDVDDNATDSEMKMKPSVVKNNEIIKSAFLGTIYKELSAIEKSKTLDKSDRDQEHDFVDIIKMHENKPTTNTKKLSRDVLNVEEPQRALDLGT